MAWPAPPAKGERGPQPGPRPPRLGWLPHRSSHPLVAAACPPLASLLPARTPPTALQASSSSTFHASVHGHRALGSPSSCVPGLRPPHLPSRPSTLCGRLRFRDSFSLSLHIATVSDHAPRLWRLLLWPWPQTSANQGSLHAPLSPSLCARKHQFTLADRGAPASGPRCPWALLWGCSHSGLLPRVASGCEGSSQSHKGLGGRLFPSLILPFHLPPTLSPTLALTSPAKHLQTAPALSTARADWKALIASRWGLQAFVHSSSTGTHT